MSITEPTTRPETPSSPRTVPASRRWRIPLVLGGIAMALGGPMHPESDAKDSLRDELATMTAGDTWVQAHVLIAVGTALLALALVRAHRSQTWPTSTRRALQVAAVAMSAYVVETVLHLAAVIDTDRLAEGDPAPIAFTHIGLALLLYPISGIAFVRLNATLLGAVEAPVKPLAALGILAGTLHAASVPLTMVLPDTELTPMFAGAGMTLAAWSIGVGLLGMRAKAGDDGESEHPGRSAGLERAVARPDRPSPVR